MLLQLPSFVRLTRVVGSQWHKAPYSFLLLPSAHNMLFQFTFRAAHAAGSPSLICPAEAKCLSRAGDAALVGAKCPNWFGTWLGLLAIGRQAHPVAAGPRGSFPLVAVPLQQPFVRGRSAVLHTSPPGPSFLGHF